MFHGNNCWKKRLEVWKMAQDWIFNIVGCYKVQGNFERLPSALDLPRWSQRSKKNRVDKASGATDGFIFCWSWTTRIFLVSMSKKVVYSSCVPERTGWTLFSLVVSQLSDINDNRARKGNQACRISVVELPDFPHFCVPRIHSRVLLNMGASKRAHLSNTYRLNVVIYINI